MTPNCVLVSPHMHHVANRLHGQGHIGWLLTIALLATGWFLAPIAQAISAEQVSPIRLAELVTQQANQLATVESDEQAMTLFSATIGPSLGMKDAAGAVSTKRMPSKMAKELGVAELSQSVHELIATLAAWQMADSISHGTFDASATAALPATRQEWLKSRSRVGSLTDLFRLTQGTPSQAQRLELESAAYRAAYEASQRATAVWWELSGWKERIRQAKGQSRLCGTWQWIVHNHQRHGEQKGVMVFPPAGQTQTQSPTPAEMIILGDSIYLRWEEAGHVQEDSLLFVKDDQLIEGSFMSNTGGWGPISGKRIAGCKP